MKDKQAAQTSSIVYAHLGYARVFNEGKRTMKKLSCY